MSVEPLEQPLVKRASELAAIAHAQQLRKAGAVPYIEHLAGVARLLASHGYTDEITLAAAHLHDLLEDQPAYAERFRAEFPEDVVETVSALTEQKVDDNGRKLDKRRRFAGYVAGLEVLGRVARHAIPISCADKIDNLRSLTHGAGGNRLLFSLSTRPGEHAGQLHALRRLYAPVVNETLLQAFDEAAERLFELIEVLLPGHALAIAAEAHRGQLDKAGQPYILHPLRLMFRAGTRDEQLTAVLHDVLEDSAWTEEQLAREGIPRNVLRALDCLTRRKDETYEAFIERVAGDGLATRVKLLDLEDNSDPTRLAAPSPADLERIAKYRRAIERLRPEAAFRTLSIVLDEPSRRRVRRLAIHPELRADHVTLAFRVDPATFRAEWVPGRAAIGDTVELSVVGHVFDRRVQALLVEIAGTRERPFDGGILHLTVSTTSDARAVEANALIASGTSTVPLTLGLAGTLQWEPV